MNEIQARRKTTFGHIDSASITQVVQAFDVYPRDSVPHGWDIPLFATSLLISTRNIGLAPGVSRTGILSEGPIGDVTRRLLSSGIVARRRPKAETREGKLKETKERIHTYTSRYKKKFESLMKEAGDEVIGWSDWSRRRAWVEHFQNSGTLVDKQFIPEMALISDIGQDDIRRLHEETSRLQVVKALSRQESATDFSDKVSRCFLLAALLRGMYHDYVATVSRRQVAHHPLREPFLRHLDAPPAPFAAQGTEGLLASIVLWDALCEKKLEGRLFRWAENVAKIREANRKGHWPVGFDLRTREEPRLACEAAAEAARTIDICVCPRELEEFLVATVGTVFDVGMVLLTPFLGLAGSIGLSASKRALEYRGVGPENIVRKGVRGVYGRHNRLAKLAKSPPGRLSPYRRIFPL